MPGPGEETLRIECVRITHHGMGLSASAAPCKDFFQHCSEQCMWVSGRGMLVLWNHWKPKRWLWCGGSEHLPLAASVWVPVRPFISWTMSVVVSPVCTMVKTRLVELFGDWMSKCTWSASQNAWHVKNLRQVFVIFYHLLFNSTESSEFSCHMYQLCMKAQEGGHEGIITSSMVQMGHEVHTSEVIAWLCSEARTFLQGFQPHCQPLYWAWRISRTPIPYMISLSILYWPILKLKSPSIFSLTSVWLADRFECWDCGPKPGKVGRSPTRTM